MWFEPYRGWRRKYEPWEKQENSGQTPRVGEALVIGPSPTLGAFGRSSPVFLTPAFCLLMPATSLSTIAINPEKIIGYLDYMHSAYGKKVWWCERHIDPWEPQTWICVQLLGNCSAVYRPTDRLAYYIVLGYRYEVSMLCLRLILSMVTCATSPKLDDVCTFNYWLQDSYFW